MAEEWKEEDEEIKEAYEELLEKEEEKKRQTPRNIVGRLPQGFLIPIIIFSIFILYLTFVTKTIDKASLLWIIVGIVIIMMVMSSQIDFDKREPIAEEQLKAFLYMELKKKQRVNLSEIPMGKIDILLPCKAKKVEGKLIKYVLSFKITSISGLEKYYTAEMDPYTKYILGFEERPAGFKGTEISDIKFIRRKEDIWEDKYFSKKKKK